MPNRNNHYSEEAQDILGKIPAWIIRWGITVITIVFIGVIMGCYFIKYPKVVESQASITTVNPPSNLNARYSGLIDSICVVNGQKVNEGDLLMLLSTPAKYRDVMKVEQELKRQNRDILEENSWIDEKYILGDLQASWSELQRQILDYRHYNRIDHIGRKVKLLTAQINKNNEYYDKLKMQNSLIQQELNYDIKAFQRDSILLSKNVISLSDFEITAKNLVGKENNKVGFDANITSTELNILQIQQQIVELDTQEQNERAEYERIISQLRQQFLAQISQWKEQYVVIAPTSGKVSLHDYWSKNQHVNVGDILASVEPNDAISIIGKIKIPSTGFGNVKVGQNVNVKLNGFPYMEFGVLRGVISSISSVPEQNKTQNGMTIVYQAQLEFPNALTTSYKKELPMIQQMDGIAEIITEDMRLIEQFVQPIVSLFRN